MIYTEQEIQDIERYAGLRYKPEEVAVLLRKNTFEFLSDYENQETGVKDAFRRGLLLADAERREATKKSPKMLQEFNEMQKEKEFDQLVQKLFDFKEMENNAE